jgi:uncharacterized membrane protein
MQFLHVLTAILWVGGGFYTLVVQLPALLAVPPPARGPVMAQIVPRQVRYIGRVADFTILTGFLNLIATQRAQQFLDPFGQRWTIVLGLGILLSLVLLGLLHGVVEPAVRRMLEIGPKAAAGDAAAAAEMPKAIDRLRRLGIAQIVLAVLIVIAMVSARLS